MKIAVITGASSGMGREFVYALDRAARGAAGALPREVRVLALDLLDTASFDVIPCAPRDAAGDRRARERGGLRRVRPVRRAGSENPARHHRPQRPGADGHVPSRAAVSRRGQPDLQHGLHVLVAAGAVYQRLRREQGLCALVLPGARRGAAAARRARHGRLPRLDHDGVFRPRRHGRHDLLLQPLLRPGGRGGKGAARHEAREGRLRARLPRAHAGAAREAPAGAACCRCCPPRSGACRGSDAGYTARAPDGSGA